MRARVRLLGVFLALGMFAASAAAQNASAARYDKTIEAKVAQRLAAKQQFSRVQSTVEDGIVTLTGSVDLYQQKLDAAKRVRKTADVQGVRNLIAVEGKNVADAQLEAQLDRALYYDRVGFDAAFNFITAKVENGTATLAGEARTENNRDLAVALANQMPGVKDVVDNIKVSNASFYDDRIRLATLRLIYGDAALGHYAVDPARPIRILVDSGHVTLEGVVLNKFDKEVAGIRAGQVFGTFSVQNNLEVAGKS
ncbi:MAG: BON domain-containing protein [Terriglobales bacterium]